MFAVCFVTADFMCILYLIKLGGGMSWTNWWLLPSVRLSKFLTRTTIVSLSMYGRDVGKTIQTVKGAGS